MAGSPEGAAVDLWRGFPVQFRSAAERVLAALPDAATPGQGSFSVQVEGEELIIPRRIGNPEMGETKFAALEGLVAACLYTRHHDGYVRQRNLERIVSSSLDFVVPYVVALIGEYVVEIQEVIVEHLDLATPGSPDCRRYGAFVRANPSYFEKTAQRVRSYWNCYYRHYGITYAAGVGIDEPLPPSKQRYPGYLLIDQLRAAAADSYNPPTRVGGDRT